MGDPVTGTSIRQVGLTIHLFGKEWGLSAFLSLGERLVLKLTYCFLTRLRLPSPSLVKHFRRCFDGYLLSLVNIIQQIKALYIKKSLQKYVFVMWVQYL